MISNVPNPARVAFWRVGGSCDGIEKIKRKVERLGRKARVRRLENCRGCTMKFIWKRKTAVFCLWRVSGISGYKRESGIKGYRV